MNSKDEGFKESLSRHTTKYVNEVSNKTHTVKLYPVNHFLSNNKQMTREGGK